MAIIKKTKITSVDQDVVKKGALGHCRWECKLMQPPWKTAWRLLKILKTELPNDSAIPLLGIYPKRARTLSQKAYLHPHGHNNVIYNSQGMETA